MSSTGVPIPVGRRKDPLDRSEIPVLNLLRWFCILGTLVFGVVTIYRFSTTPQHADSWGFLVLAILFAFVWRTLARRIANPR